LRRASCCKTPRKLRQLTQVAPIKCRPSGGYSTEQGDELAPSHELPSTRGGHAVHCSKICLLMSVQGLNPNPPFRPLCQFWPAADITPLGFEQPQKIPRRIGPLTAHRFKSSIDLSAVGWRCGSEFAVRWHEQPCQHLSIESRWRAALAGLTSTTARVACGISSRNTQFIAAKVSTTGILLTLMMPMPG